MSNKKDPKSMTDSELEAATREVYGFKSSNKDVVKRRIQIAAQMARRGKDVKQYGAKGGGIKNKKRAVKASNAAGSREVVVALGTMIQSHRKEKSVAASVVRLSSGRTVDLSGLADSIELASSARRERAKSRIRKARGEFKRGDGQSTGNADKLHNKKQGDGSGEAKWSTPSVKRVQQKPGAVPAAYHGNTARKTPHAGPNSDRPEGPGHKGRGRRMLTDPTKSKFKKGIKMSRQPMTPAPLDLGVPASVLKSKSPRTPNSDEDAKQGSLPNFLNKANKKSKRTKKRGGANASVDDLKARLKKAVNK